MRKFKTVLILLVCVFAALMLSSCGCEHQAVVDQAVAATCTEHGLTEGSHCILCGDVLIEQQETELKAHKEKTINVVKATCEADGLTEGKSCSVCETVLVEQETVPATGHTSMTVPASESTCTTPAYSEGTKCSVCNKMLNGHEETAPAKGHIEETVSGYAATCDKDGKTDGTKCSVCGDVIKAQTTIKKKGHSTDTGKCSACGEYIGNAWTVSYYVDEFGDYTDEAYVHNGQYFAGTYYYGSSPHSLNVKVLIDDLDGGRVAFKLYEYGDDLANWYGTYDFTVTVKSADGKKYNMKATFYDGSDRVFLNSRYVDTFTDLLSGSGVISVYMECKTFKQSYLFDVETSNFAVEYDKIS